MRRALYSTIIIMLSAPSTADILISSDWYDRDTYSHFGGHGLVQMPSARFGEVGDFSLGWQRISPYRYTTANITPFPWLEASLRYTTQEDRPYALAQSLGVTQGNKDKGIDVKVRLLEEDVWLPQVAAGIRDLGGTGLFGSEYLVASKRFGPVDWSLGIGWGLIGTQADLKNPMTLLGSRFSSRSAQTGLGGTFALDDWFSGDNIGVFGGIEIRTPIDQLTFKAEIDGNDYSADASRSSIDPDSRFNYGLVYRANRYFDFHLGFERGNTVSTGISLRTQFGKSYQPVKRDLKPQSLASTDDNSVYRALSDEGFQATGLTIVPGELSAYGQFNRFPDKGQGLGRAAYLMHQVDPHADIRIVETYYGMPLAEWNLPANAVALRYDRNLDANEVRPSVKRTDAARSIPVLGSGNWTTKLSFEPDLEQGFQGPEAAWIYRLKLSGVGEIRYKESTSLAAQTSTSISDNFDRLVTLDTATMPPVRTEARTYLRENRNFSLDRLQLTHFEKLSNSVFTQAYIGHLEPMFSGYGGQVVYSPFDAAWSVGADINSVRKRAYNSFAGRQEYAVVTGHLTGVYTLGKQGVTFRTDIGRYLAGDVGVTLDLSRRLSNGFTVGVWATKTDVSAAEFGEGSFDKGAYVSIPFDLFTTESTLASGRIYWRPMLRDGGAKLSKMFDLHGLSGIRGEAGAVDQWDMFGQ